MPNPIPIPCEAARYAAPILYLPDLWADAVSLRGWGTYLGHRGWEGWLFPLRDVAGGLGARVEAVVEAAGRLPGPPVLLGHGAGAVVAVAAARRTTVAASVLLAPTPPGSPILRQALFRARVLQAILLGRRIPPPGAGSAWLHGLPVPLRAQVHATLGEESRSAVFDVARGRWPALDAPGPPALLVSGALDPALSGADAATLAGTLGAELHTLDDAGHWLLTGPAWQRGVDLVHRWLVQRLGEPLLETYAAALADRDDPDR